MNQRRDKKVNRRSQKKKPNKGWYDRMQVYFEEHNSIAITRVVIAALLAFVAIFLFGSYIAYIFAGAEDQSVVMNHSISDLNNDSGVISNQGGANGAYIMHNLVNNWLGLPVIFIFYYLVVLVIGLARVARVNYIKQLLFVACATVWSSLLLTALAPLFKGALFFNPGGRVGIDLYQSLYFHIGPLGITLLLVIGFVFIIFLFFSPLQRKYFAWVERRDQQLDRPRSAQDIEYDPNALDPIPDEKEPSKPKNRWWKKFVRTSKKVAEPIPDDVADTEEDEELAPDRDNDTYTIGDTFAKEEEDEINQPVPQVSSDDDIYTNDRKTEANEVKKVILGHTPAHDNNSSDDLDIEVVDVRQNDDMADLDDNNPQAMARELVREQGILDPRKDLSGFKFPSLDLLENRTVSDQAIDQEEIRLNKEKITSTLQSFGVEITSIRATVGPTITLYEVVPDSGVRISRIRNLEDDIALSLSALGIRIIAPIPGKGTIGLEVPNKKPQIVSMRSVLSSKKFVESTYDLPVALGRTITNEVFTFDLTKIPHLLVAGATGQGKSVGLNAIITSLLYKKHPSELKFVMIDPKVVEFSVYKAIERHYLAKLATEEKGIITDAKRVVMTLNSLCVEMDNRYQLLSRARVRNVKEYNEKYVNRLLNPAKGHRYLPYIVLIIDEYGDLIMSAGKEIENPLARLAQKARAVGIHAIIATQRPTASIITGTIKANFPGRMSFRVFSMIDSRTILDAPGANRLVGKGDLLYSQGNDFIRVQCAFIDTPEVNRVVEHIAAQPAYPNIYELPEVSSPGDGASGADGLATSSERDPLFEQVARAFILEQQASTSSIQRKYSIGYNRAGRLMDQLERAGVVGPADGSKPRDVLMASEDQLDAIL